MKITMSSAIAAFGRAAKTKLANPSATGEPEDQLRAPFETLLGDLAAVAAHPAFTARFQDDLSTPGLRIPLTADHATFAEAAQLGRTIIWLHTFGERMANAKQGRPPGPPRLPAARRPRVGAEIPPEADKLGYDAAKKRLLVGTGFIEHVPPAVWRYEVSGKQVLMQWFSYRRKRRERPIIGDRRPPSPLGDLQPDHWLPEYTTTSGAARIPPTASADPVCAGRGGAAP